MRKMMKAQFRKRHLQTGGFSMLEMLVSIAIIVLLMSAVFPFLFQAQKRFQGNIVISEANQGARAGLEVMSQEIGQAGYNPQFFPNKTLATSIATNGQPRCVSVSPDIVGIHPGDWVSVDAGANQELVEVFATSDSASLNSATWNSSDAVPSTCTSASTPWIEAKFMFDHASGVAVNSYKMPYGGGLLYKSDGTESNDYRMEFFGDIYQNGTVQYVVYSLSPMVPATTVTVNGTTYTLYNLYRSITEVPFPSLQSQPSAPTFTPSCPGVACNNQASPMVEKVLYNTSTASGPTGEPVFAYPSPITVGVVPNQITVVGTIVITLCVAVNPQAMETNQVTWYTMATQIRPLNLTGSLNVSNNFGGLYIPPTPSSLPMATDTSTYYP